MLAAASHSCAGVHRPAVQPCRPSAISHLRDIELCSTDRRDRGRSARASAAGRQPGIAPRYHRRSRHGSRVPPRRAPRKAWTPVQRLLRPGLSHSRPARRAHQACRRRRSGWKSIPIGFDRATTPSSPVIDRASARKRAGSRAYQSTAPSGTCSTTGVCRSPADHDRCRTFL